MNTITDKLKPLADRLEALSVRERVVITVTVIAATVFLWSEAVLRDQLTARNASLSRVSQLRGEIGTLQVEQTQLEKQLAQDPNRDLERRLARYRDEIGRVDGLLEEQTLEFISPRQMVTVLKNMIKRESGLKLVRMESLDPVDPVAALAGDGSRNGDAPDNNKTRPASGAYLHALEIELEGDYLSVLNYIRHLESLEWKFVWRSLSVEMVDYPTTTARLRLETLSQSDGWIGV